MNVKQPHIVIVGAGFGGLWAARALARFPLRITLLDKNNYHTFLPLLYQVAAAELEPGQIGYPIRSILRGLNNVRFVLAEVTAVDLSSHQVHTADTSFVYDYLILATGSISRFFGIPGAAEHAFSLKTMEEGLALRNHILGNFERADREKDPAKRRELLTFAVVGGGPTGVEYAGSLAELINGPLAKDYPLIFPHESRVILLEGAGSLLAALPAKLGRYALERLQEMGVDVRLGAMVSAVAADCVTLGDGTAVPSRTVVWTAGVGGELLPQKSQIPTNGGGRVPVQPTLQLPGHERVFVVGDLARLEQDGRPLPMVAPVATQQGTHTAVNIMRHLQNEELLPFRYKDRGAMSTIGRNAAVAYLRGRAFSGFLAWIIWLVIHLYNLIGFRNRLVVLINWAWNYFFYERVVRLILPSLPNDADQ